MPIAAEFARTRYTLAVTIKPAGIIDDLGLEGSERVLEIGPGSGFLSVEIARRLDSRSLGAKLDLFDVQLEMLAKAARQLKRAGFYDIGYTAGEASNGIPFPDSTFGVAFLAAVIGEVPDPQTCVRSLGYALMFPDPDRLSVARLCQLVEPEGFAFVGSAGNRLKEIVTFGMVWSCSVLYTESLTVK